MGHKVYIDYSNAELFRKLSSASYVYAEEAKDNDDMKGKPKAIDYRLKVLKQFITELQLRADEMKYEKTI